MEILLSLGHAVDADLRVDDSVWWAPTQKDGSATGATAQQKPGDGTEPTFLPSIVMSANDGHGQLALPVAGVAICRLRIRADWTPPDIGNLEQSAQPGQFNIDSTVRDCAIGDAGVQLIGWLLQGMPMLPPQGSDAAVTAPVGTGDSAGVWSDSDGCTIFSQDGGDVCYSQRRDGAAVSTGSGRMVGGQLMYRDSSGQDAGTCTGDLGPDGAHIDGTRSSGGDSCKFGIWRWRRRPRPARRARQEPRAAAAHSARGEPASKRQRNFGWCPGRRAHLPPARRKQSQACLRCALPAPSA